MGYAMQVTLYAIDNSEGEHYCLTFESKEAAKAFNDAWEFYTEGTCYGAERMEEGCAVTDAKHVITLAEVQAVGDVDDDDWDKVAEAVCDISAQYNENTFVVLQTNEVGVFNASTLCDYLILNRQTGEKRWLRECALLDDMAGFSEDDWDELEII